MAICPLCGEYVVEGSPYCPECGNDLEWDDEKEDG